MYEQNNSQPPYKVVPVREAITTLQNIEVGLTGLENDFEYFEVLQQANSLVSSIIRYGMSKQILSCERIELLDGGRSGS